MDESAASITSFFIFDSFKSALVQIEAIPSTS